MTDNNRNNHSRPDDQTGRSHGPQGVDKAPGEETAADTENVINITQKGKNKVDGDPSKPSDQPLNPQ